MDGGIGGVPLDGQTGGIPGIPGGGDNSSPSIIPGGEVGPVVIPTIPPAGGAISLTPSISGGGVGPIVIPIITGGGGITVTPTIISDEIGPIVIPTLPPALSGGDDGSLAGSQSVTTLPSLSATRKTSLSTFTPPVSSPTDIPGGGSGAGNNNYGLVTSVM